MDQEIASKEENGSAGNNEEIYRYGLFLLKHDLVNIVVSLAIGTLLGCLRECVAFALSYMMLRRYMGGYHASKPIICVVASITMQSVSSVLAHYAEPNPNMLFLVIAVYLVLYSGIPAETRNRPLNSQERDVFRRITVLIMVLYVVVSMILFDHGWLFNCILYAIMCCECLLTIQLFVNCFGKNNYKTNNKDMTNGHRLIIHSD